MNRHQVDVPKLMALCAAYEDYVALLEQGLRGMTGLAVAHGWRGADEEDVQRGIELRARIAALKKGIT